MKTRAINLALILGKATKDELSELALAACDDPGLPILCPLAKAAYQKATSGRISEEVASTALSTIFAIAGEDGEALLEGESIVVFTTEHVDHTIEACLPNGKSLNVNFRSEGSISTFLGNSDAWVPLDSIPRSPVNTGELAQDEIAAAITEKISDSSPQCYPCDTDFIGIITYGITDIGGIRVNDFSAVDYRNAFELTHQLTDPEEGDCDSFRWTDLLEEHQLAELGIRRGGDPAEQWELISREQMAESYQRGNVTRREIDRFLLCLGCGERWKPDGIIEDEWATVIDDDAEDEVFDPLQLPILTFVFPDGDSDERQGFAPVLELIDALYQSIPKL
ncbi:hypothetical protein [Vulcanococcus sp. Clear-D1]|uniref:hypothetical protein n=1 Tax=Vulcanococcus sp. Clear-D1 TaxID=2766970 RepID=UPI0019CBA6E3|nr:hypothetical protein [Vulcanococcus sp. Clear-D1]MBD1194480.1 hypothetical protein [Vulcanococcus sp. Clear-D1]